MDMRFSWEAWKGQGDMVMDVFEEQLGMKELASLLKVNRNTVYKWIMDDEYSIKSHMWRLGSSWRISLEGYNALLEEMKKGSK